MLQEMIAQSEVKNFTAPVNGLGEGGSIAETELVRVGVFTTATANGGKFVEVKRGERGIEYARERGCTADTGPCAVHVRVSTAATLPASVRRCVEPND